MVVSTLPGPLRKIRRIRKTIRKREVQMARNRLEKARERQTPRVLIIR